MGAWVRIFLRYGVGFFAGRELGAQLAMDQDVTLALTALGIAAIEGVYIIAKKRGWNL